jgi:endonuclease/exonuclease/phosphatase family metal-dependent hydrolase
MIRAVLSVATWNLKFNSTPERTLSYLQHARWDIACLQEVSRSASALLAQRENWTVVDGLQLASQQLSSWKRPHASAIVARNGWRLEDSRVLADTPTPGRGVQALARRGAIPRCCGCA